MLTFIFAAIAVINGIGWLVRSISMMAMIKYMIDKNVPDPTDEEFEECVTFVVKHMLHIE